MEIWEDQIGYDELRNKITAIQKVFIALTYRGLNLISPQTAQELIAYDAINESMNLVISNYYVWQTQKIAYHTAENIIYVQLLKKETERIIDIDSTRANMRLLLNTPNILDRSKITENIIVYKAATE
jgi:hypothetical protein